MSRRASLRGQANSRVAKVNDAREAALEAAAALGGGRQPIVSSSPVADQDGHMYNGGGGAPIYPIAAATNGVGVQSKLEKHLGNGPSAPAPAGRRSVGFVQDHDNVSTTSQAASVTSAALAVKRGALRAAAADADRHEQPSDMSIGSHFDLDLTSVADTTITTKYGSPIRRQTDSQQHEVAVRRRKSKPAFPKSSILKIKASASVFSRASSKKKKKKRAMAKSGKSVRSESSRLTWLSPQKNARKLKKVTKKAVRFAAEGSPRKKTRVSGETTATSTPTILTATKKATRDAYMCCVCGAAFSLYAKTEAHEEKCVRNAFGPSFPTEQAERRQPPRQSVSTSMLAHVQNSTMEYLEARAEPSADDRGQGSIVDETHIEDTDCKTDGRLYLSPAPEHPDKTFPGQNGGDLKCANLRVETSVEPTRMGAASSQSTRRQFDILSCRTDTEPGAIHLSDSMRRYIMMTDEAILKVVERATPFMVMPDEIDAERELALLARDRAFYDLLEARRRKHLNKGDGTRTGNVGKDFVNTVKGRFSEAYRLIKEGDEEGTAVVDLYKNRSGAKGAETADIYHNDSTLYINVVVKNSVGVINNELKRLANTRWENTQQDGAPIQKQQQLQNNPGEAFEWFRAVAQLKIVQLASLALQSDFTPRRIAIQLSNDLYRLLGPTLKARGVTIQTELEYRAGAYFVLAVNIERIDWRLFLRHTNQEVRERRRRWKESLARRNDGGDQRSEDDQREKDLGWRVLYFMHRFYLPSFDDCIGMWLAGLYYIHWIVSVPICVVSHYLFLGQVMRRYILTSTSEDIFKYVEKKGMEMNLSVTDAKEQASFMLAALREMRNDERARKKKKAEAEGEEEVTIIGPLLGPAYKEDKDPASPPADFVPPDNLEDVNFEMDLPVGFRRLRWAVMHKDSDFMELAVMKTESNYENITTGSWSKHNDEIGLHKTPDGIDIADFVGTTMETSYLMPSSAFVKANMAYETATIAQYDDYCLCIKKATRTPDVP